MLSGKEYIGKMHRQFHQEEHLEITDLTRLTMLNLDNHARALPASIGPGEGPFTGKWKYLEYGRARVPVRVSSIFSSRRNCDRSREPVGGPEQGYLDVTYELTNSIGGNFSSVVSGLASILFPRWWP
ncbi:MAG: hypothetical protein WD032_07305 [Nitrospirales bacterium]